MKSSNMKYKMLLLFAGSLLWAAMPASALDKTEKISRSYKVTAATTIEVINKYGKVEVIPWNKDSVRIDIELTVRASNEERLEKLFSNVDFDFVSTPGFVTARTVIGSRSTSVWTDISTLTKTMFTNGSDMTIDYVVYLPARNKLLIENKYGDVFTGALTGKVRIDLAHGSLKATTYQGQCDITLKYGNASINAVKSASFFFEYADLNLEKADKLLIESRSGEIQIDQVNFLRMNARRGDYTVKEADVIQGESFFTNSTFNLVSQKIYLDCRYGGLNVLLIEKDFNSIRLDIKYSDVNLTFEAGTTYELEVAHKNSTITFPQDKAELNTTAVEGDDKEKRTTGKVGLSAEPSGRLQAVMDRGTLNLFAK